MGNRKRDNDVELLGSSAFFVCKIRMGILSIFGMQNGGYHEIIKSRNHYRYF